mgnify:CR=1 FL=1
MAEVQSTFNLKLGEIAPEFNLNDGAGNEHTLSKIKGHQGTLVIFACNHCPFVLHLGDAISELAKEIQPQGINTVAINSNDIENYPADSPDKMLEFANEYDWDFPYLYDPTQEVAKSYSAACTPDFYLLDADNKLVYLGQFDESRPNNGKPVNGTDIKAAIHALLSGKSPLDNQLPSSGCNIKWKPGQKPSYF